MQAHTTRIRTLAASGVVAVAVLVVGSAGAAKTPTNTVRTNQTGQLGSYGSDRDGGEIYVWMVNGVQRGIPFR